MDYFDLPQVSNSDLSWLKEHTSGKDVIGNKERAYYVGNLTDAILTESDKIDFLKKTFNGHKIVDEDFEQTIKMRDAFLKDRFCRNILTLSSPQKIIIRDVEIEYQEIKFTLPMRCKYDLFMDTVEYGGDIKSTVCKTREEFETSIDFFDYDRQRAVYMTLAECDYDVLIGISKNNFKIFKKFIKRDDETFIRGMNKFRYLAYKYYNLFY